ncbi:Uncharacterised protein [Clostridium paraputrificum]|uniref:hypothetical protein n=1 Tax=Clostridium paraputrificum TaxID=29363 RepID=UPI0006C42C16|nr:hypothetical protein [Clostridium paraputrificum]CUQ08415.1 Uncharacterised protein [Clostridium paraputrificum]
MGTRKVYYYSLDLREVRGNIDVTKNIKNIFDDIINSNAQKIDSVMTLSLQNDKITLDILKNNSEFLFARVGKETEHYNILKRDKSTKKSEEVLTRGEKDKILEVCTYFLLDYKNGIVGFVFGQAAPTPNAIVSIITDYSDKYTLCIDRISSPESVRSLLKPGSAIKKVKYVMRTPNIEILDALNIKPGLKKKMIHMPKQEIEILIKNGNKSMFSSVEEMKEFIEEIFSAQEKEDIVLYGNSGGGRQKEFKFLEQDISYSIDIKEYDIEGTIRRRLSNDEIQQNVYNDLKALYSKNYEEILMYAGKYYEELEQVN